MSAVSLSILDRANTRMVDGQPVDASTILSEVTDRARAAEALGYQRFWVAEHHSVPGIVGSVPTLLLAHLASVTSTIRLGTGGIMVPKSVMPEAMARLAEVSPMSWALDAFLVLLVGQGSLSDVAPYCARLLLFAAIVGALALFLFLKRMNDTQWTTQN